MSNDAASAEQPRRKHRWISWLVPSTVAGWAALLTWLFLCLMVAVVWAIFYADPNNVPWRHSISIGRVLLIIALVFVIPVVLYRALRLWLEGEMSLYPEIDHAWTAGLEAIEDQGLDIKEMAFYLIVGSRGIGQERAIMQSGQLDLRVEGVPEGPAPLHWYATSDSAYLFCTDSSWASALAAKRQRHFEEFGDPATQNRASTAPLRSAAVMSPGEPGAAPATATPPVANPMGTVHLDQFLAQSQLSAAPPANAPNTAEAGALRGTLQLDSGFIEPLHVAAPEPVFGDTGSGRKPITISSKESTQRVGRLTYLCQRIHRVREPLCPINGILTLLPYAAIDGGTGDAEALQQALKADLTTIHYMLQIRCPTTALVVDMERQQGFRELMRRVGRDRVSAQRFGRKYDCRSLATKAEMAALSEHVCGTFEDWVYALFREDEALTRPGNQRLYHLLCEIRCTLKGRLTTVLQEVFAYDPAQGYSDDALLFSGCYFAATGERSDHRAFIGGILAKLDEEQEVVEWTSEALLLQQRWERAATAGLVLCLVLGGLLLWMLLW